MEQISQYAEQAWAWMKGVWRDGLAWYQAQSMEIRILVLSAAVLLVLVLLVRIFGRKKTHTEPGTLRNPGPRSADDSRLQHTISQATMYTPEAIKQIVRERLEAEARKVAGSFYNTLCHEVAKGQYSMQGKSIVIRCSLPEYGTGYSVQCPMEEDERLVFENAEKAGIIQRSAYIYGKDSDVLSLHSYNNPKMSRMVKGPLWDAFEQELLRLCGREIQVLGYYVIHGGKQCPAFGSTPAGTVVMEAKYHR